MIIKNFVFPPIENNNYLIIDEQSKEAALIDCSYIDKTVLDELNEHQANLKYVLLTHGHFDHISGINDIPFSVKVFMHKEDMEWVSEVNSYLPMIGMPSMEVPAIDEFIKDGDIIKLGEIDIKVIHTPGHTQGGVCYYIDNALFSGDTIFKESVGRCDLPGGDFNQIVESIEKKIFTLPDDTIIYPGHGKITNVGWEKEHNSYM